MKPGRTLARERTTAETSLAALTLEAASGRLAQRQRRALEALGHVVAATDDADGTRHLGRPATTGEVIRDSDLGGNVNLWRARFTELALMGAIVKCGTRRCAASGRECMTWGPAPWPWVPSARAKQTPAALRALLREAADVIEELASAVDHGDSSTRASEMQAGAARARAAAYREIGCGS